MPAPATERKTATVTHSLMLNDSRGVEPCRRRFLSVLALALACMAPASAWAHAAVLSSQPARNAVVVPGELSFRLQFSSRVDPARSRLTLVAPDQGQTRVSFSEQSPGVLSGQMRVGTPGPWMLRWQVLSLDGHVTRGEVPFTVRAGAGTR